MLEHLQAKLATLNKELAKWSEVEGRLRTELEELRQTPIKDAGDWSERARRATVEYRLEDSLSCVEFGWSRERPNPLTRVVGDFFEDGRAALAGKPPWWLRAPRDQLAADVAEAEARPQQQVAAAEAMLAEGDAAAA